MDFVSSGVEQDRRIKKGDGANIQRWTKQPSGLIRFEDSVPLFHAQEIEAGTYRDA